MYPLCMRYTLVIPCIPLLNPPLPNLNGHKLAFLPQFHAHPTPDLVGDKLTGRPAKITIPLGLLFGYLKVWADKRHNPKISRNVKSHWFPVVSFVFFGLRPVNGRNRDLQSGSVGSFSKAERFQVPRDSLGIQGMVGFRKDLAMKYLMDIYWTIHGNIFLMGFLKQRKSRVGWYLTFDHGIYIIALRWKFTGFDNDLMGTEWLFHADIYIYKYTNNSWDSTKKRSGYAPSRLVCITSETYGPAIIDHITHTLGMS